MRDFKGAFSPDVKGRPVQIDIWYPADIRGSACLDLSLADSTVLRIFHTEANFYRVGVEDFPTQFLEVPKFREGLRVDFHDKQIQWFVLAEDGERQAVSS